MSVSYRASVIVGLPYGEFTDSALADLLIDKGRLAANPVYYDACSDECVIGLEFAQTDDYSYTEFAYDQDEIELLQEKFFQLTGQFARVFLTTYGY